MDEIIRRVAAALRTNKASLSKPEAESLARAAMAAMPKTVWVYDQGEKLKVFATAEAAQAWFDKNDREGVAFQYEVEG